MEECGNEEMDWKWSSFVRSIHATQCAIIIRQAEAHCLNEGPGKLINYLHTQ